jgi:hypothetical protein
MSGPLLPLSSIRATCPAHLIADLVILIILVKEYTSHSSSFYSFLHTTVTLSPFGTNILLSTMISNTLGLCSSLGVRDHVSHPHRTTGKITVLHILIFKLFDNMKRQKVLDWLQASITRTQSLLNLLLNQIFIFLYISYSEWPLCPWCSISYGT